MLNMEWQEAIEGFLAHERAGGKRSTSQRADDEAQVAIYAADR